MIPSILWNTSDKDWKSSGCDKIRKSNADSDLIMSFGSFNLFILSLRSRERLSLALKFGSFIKLLALGKVNIRGA